MQADLAQREMTPARDRQLKQSLKQIGRSSMRATHTVNQLLALARAEGSGTGAAPAAAATWRALDHRGGARLRAARAGQAHRPRLRRRRSPATPASPLRRQADAAQGADAQPGGQRDQLHAARGGTRVTARVLADPFGQVVVLQVEDTGPGHRRGRARAGVPAVLPRAGHRASTAPGWAWPSCGRSPQQHGAEVTLEDAHPRADGGAAPGTLVTVRFAARQACSGSAGATRSASQRHSAASSLRRQPVRAGGRERHAARALAERRGAKPAARAASSASRRVLGQQRRRARAPPASPASARRMRSLPIQLCPLDCSITASVARRVQPEPLRQRQRLGRAGQVDRRPAGC